MAYQVLRLVMKEEDVDFSLLQRGEQNNYYELESKPYKFNPDPLTRETIDLLVKLQHLMADAVRRPRELPRDEVDEALWNLVEVLGKHLYKALFDDYVNGHLERGLRDLPSEELLRIELRFEGDSEPSRSGWPWEYLYSPTKEKFVALLGDLVLSRQLKVNVSKESFETVKPKVLLVVAGPGDEGPVVCDAVITKVEELRDQGKIDLVEPLVERIDRKDLPQPDPYEPIASRAKFEALVKSEQPHIIHFIGHGQRGGRNGQLALVGKDGKADWVNGERFAEIARQSKELKLAFLQACESALPDPDPHGPTSSVARELFRSGTPAVVAMQAKVENEIANTFACEFYRALGQRDPVDLAVAKGRAAIRNLESEAIKKKSKNEAKNLAAFGVPVLYLRRFEPLIASKSSGESQLLGKGPGEPEKCPRCGAAIARGDQKACTRCGLRLWCDNPNCPRGKLDDPQGRICGECSTPIAPSPPWSALLEDQVQSGAAMRTMPPTFVPAGANETVPAVPPNLRGVNAGRPRTI
jgi:hypothetical protein